MGINLGLFHTKNYIFFKKNLEATHYLVTFCLLYKRAWNGPILFMHLLRTPRVCETQSTSEISFFSSPSPSSERSMKKSFPSGVLSMYQPPSEIHLSPLDPGVRVLVWGAVLTLGEVSTGSLFGVGGTESGFPFLYKLSRELFIWFADCRFTHLHIKKIHGTGFNLDYLYLEVNENYFINIIQHYPCWRKQAMHLPTHTKWLHINLHVLAEGAVVFAIYPGMTPVNGQAPLWQ